MSTDVVAERVVRGSLHIHAFSVKQRSEIIGPKAASVANKLSIEETYWKYFKAKWEIVISDDLPVIETDNIVRLYDVLNHVSFTRPLNQKRSIRNGGKELTAVLGGYAL